MNKAIEIQGEHAIALPDERLELLRATYGQGCSAAEFELFVAAARRLGLDPFARQITLTPRRKKSGGRWVEVFEPVVTIDGFRAVAERSGTYEGQTAAQWCGPSGNWLDVWLASDPPVACRVGVYRQGWREPIWGIALWDAYAAKKHDGSLIGWWAKGGAHMLAKCAEALALRRAFPNVLGGVYSPEEMQQAQGARAQAPQPPAKTEQAPKVIEATAVESYQVKAKKRAKEEASKPQAVDAKTRSAFSSAWVKLVGVVGADAAATLWDDVGLPDSNGAAAQLGAAYPQVRELAEKLPVWVRVGSYLKVQKSRGLDVSPLPALSTSLDELQAQADELAAAVGQLEGIEVRLLARKVTEDAITRALCVRFALGTPVDADDVRRTWIDPAPLGGRVSSGTENDGTKRFDVVLNRS